MRTEQVKLYYIRKRKLNVEIQKDNTKMINFDYITKQTLKKHNPNWSKIPNYPYRILILGGSGF